MSNGLGGLARGIVQGAQVGLQLRKQEQSEREESELSKLRESQEARAQAADKRAQAAEARAQKGFETEQSLADFNKAMTEKRQALSERQEARISGSAKSQSEMQKKEFDWRSAKQSRMEQDQKLATMAPIEYQRVATGGEFSPEFMQEAEGTRFDPAYMAKPEYRDAAKVAFETVDDIVNKISEGGVKSVSLEEANNPKFIGALNTLMAPDVKRGIGDTDPKTGKKVADKEISNVFPYPDGKGLVFEVKTTLADGSSYTAPITEGRSTDPSDPVKVVPVDQFLGHIDGYMRMASAFNQPDLQNAVSRYMGTKPGSDLNSKEVTRRQYLREVGSIDKWELDQIDKVDPHKSLLPEEIEDKVKKIKDNAKKLRSNLAVRYAQAPAKSVGDGDAKVEEPSGDGEQRIDTSTWSEGDPNKQAYILEAEEFAKENGIENPLNAYTPDKLNLMYAEWVKENDAASAAAAMR